MRGILKFQVPVLKQLLQVASVVAIGFTTVPATTTAGAPLIDGDSGGVKVTELHWGEPYAAMVFHADHLWIGQSRSDKGLDYRVSVFDRDDKLVREIPLRHSPSYMSVYNDSSILVTGTSSDPNLTAWTVIKRSGDNFIASHHWIPASAWSNGWLGTIAGREYFADMGGNQNDDDMINNPTLPAQTIFSMSSSGRPRYSTARMRGPLSGWKWRDQLVILRGDSVASSLRNVVVMNPANHSFRDAIGRRVEGAGEPALMADGVRFVIAEQRAGKILFVDLESGAKEEFETGGSPLSVAAFGQCAAIGFEGEKKGLIVQASGETPATVANSFDFSQIDDRFSGLRRIAVDDVTGRIYGASVYPCNPFVQDCRGKANFVVATSRGSDSDLVQKCLN